MTCQGTPSASRQVDAAFVTVILAGMPAQIYHPRPFAHRISAESVSATLQIELRYVRSLTLGLARLQQKTRSRSKEKVGSPFRIFALVQDVGTSLGRRHFQLTWRGRGGPVLVVYVPSLLRVMPDIGQSSSIERTSRARFS